MRCTCSAAWGCRAGLPTSSAGAEVLGGIGLLIPRTVRLAAAGLIIIMAGAVIMHATVLPGGMAKGTPALVLLLLLGVVQALRRPSARLA